MFTMSVLSFKNADSIELNIELKKFLHENIPATQKMINKDLSEILWKYYQENINIQIENVEELVIESKHVDSLFLDDNKIIGDHLFAALPAA